MRRYDVQVRYPDRKGKKNIKYQTQTPPMPSRDHAIWYAACCAAYDNGVTSAHVLGWPVSIEVTEIPE